MFFTILLFILFFGLHPKGFHFKNNVKRLTDSPGIEFGEFGIAYTDQFIESGEATDFSIEVVIRPGENSEKVFSHILTIHNGNDDSQLMLGQWGENLIFMNGDDYENKKRLPRITIDASAYSPTELLLSLTSNNEGTKVYLNGQLARELKDFTLKLPEGAATSRIILGNSIYGKHSWVGIVKALAFYKTVLSETQIALTYFNWLKSQSLSYDSKGKALVLYTFQEKGTSAIDLTGHNHTLLIPGTMKPLKTKFLKAENKFPNIVSTTIWDFLINLFGFFPFGFSLSLLISKQINSSSARSLFIVACAGFFLSLFIETVQTWIPSRSSDVYDLGLNTVGAFLGAVILVMARIGEKHIRIFKY